MKTAVCTMAFGDFHTKLAETSIPTIAEYAKKIGASLRILPYSTAEKIPAYSKLNLIFDVLEDFDRVIYVDCDILIRHDAPNLFDLVPVDAIGIYDEGCMFPERRQAKAAWLNETGSGTAQWVNDKRYYNTGVIVVSKHHRRLFCSPAAEIDNFYEQTLLNYRIYHSGETVYPLPHRFNRVLKTLEMTGERLEDSYLVHFAGAFGANPNAEGNYQAWLGLADLFKKFKAAGTVPEFPRLIYIQSAGALGDVVATEPVVRYIREVLEPNADITISSHFPDVFSHIARHPRTTILPPGQRVRNLGHYVIDLFPEPPVAHYNLLHCLDYAALAAFGGTLPNAHRRIKLEVTAEPYPGIEKYVLIHPGRTWQSKTFPRDWWNAVIHSLRNLGIPVALIGKTYAGNDFRGTVDVNSDRCLDLRDKTTLPELIANISKARLLISNDSSPVHISGAFDNPTVMISTAKNPDFIWPHRNPRLNITLGKPIKASRAAIGVVNDIMMHECSELELMDALPSPHDVIEAAYRALLDRKNINGVVA